MSVSQRLRDLLDQNGVKYVVITHSQAFTAQEVAQSLHIPGQEMVKSVVLNCPEGMVLAVVPAKSRVDLERLVPPLSGKVTLAGEKEFAQRFPECEVGAMPPFGRLYGLRTYVDESLALDQEIVFNAGTHVEAVRMAFADYRRLEAPTVLRFAAAGAA